ncbi:PEP-CTERM sorting domain-containing protein [Psychromonas hadalis]|uniref:PEP-CTERM sorting domain-containing protein n=1 Tax=Psychromonas hadalis TaxID=211669 RepID=UPI0003B3EBBD|nr:PEP-CTERM sorting domain-containing protein [Psychromonas hadalis]
MKNVLLKLVAAATLLVASTSTFATPALEEITGKLDFFGAAEATLNNNKDAVTSLNFIAGFTFLAAGDYQALNVLTPVTFNNITSFAPLVLQGPLWAVGGFTFDLESITLNQADTTFIRLAGSGTLKGVGYADTAGTWTFSADDSTGIENGKFTFSASAVPAPATIALLGLALVGFGAARRKKQA